MAVASVVSKRTYIARESVIGTPVPPNRFLEDLNIKIMPNSTVGSVRPSGSTMEVDSPLIQNWSTFTLEGGSGLGYNTAFYLFAALMGVPVTTTPGGGTLSRQHAYRYGSDGLNTRPSFTMASGYRGGTAEQVSRAVFDAFGFTFSRTAQSTITGGGFAREVDMDATLGVNEVNVLTIDATGGDFTLAVNGGASTSAIAENATAGTVQTDLEALSNVAPGDVTVTGSAGGPYTLAWAGAFANTDVTLTADGTGLTGGSHTATVTTTQVGGITTVPVKSVNAPTWAVYLDDYGGTIGTTKVRPYSGEFSFTGLVTPDWVIDPDIDSLDDDVLQVPTLTCNLLMRNDATARTLYSDLLAGDKKLLRFESVGSVIEGAIPYRLRLDTLVGPQANFGQFGDQSGAETMPFPLKILSDSTKFGGGFDAELRNIVTAF